VIIGRVLRHHPWRVDLGVRRAVRGWQQRAAVAQVQAGVDPRRQGQAPRSRDPLLELRVMNMGGECIAGGISRRPQACPWRAAPNNAEQAPWLGQPVEAPPGQVN
jgi:hypothetical protein